MLITAQTTLINIFIQMGKSNIHVTKRQDGKWQDKKAGGDKASGVFNTQKEAEKHAKQILRNQDGGEVRIHGLDGKIRDSDTVKPANDPNPPKDKVH